MSCRRGQGTKWWGCDCSGTTLASDPCKKRIIAVLFRIGGLHNKHHTKDDRCYLICQSKFKTWELGFNGQCLVLMVGTSWFEGSNTLGMGRLLCIINVSHVLVLWFQVQSGVLNLLSLCISVPAEIAFYCLSKLEIQFLRTPQCWDVTVSVRWCFWTCC